MKKMVLILPVIVLLNCRVKSQSIKALALII